MEEQEALEWTLQWFVQRKGEVKLLEYYAEKRLKSLNLLDEGIAPIGLPVLALHCCMLCCAP